MLDRAVVQPEPATFIAMAADVLDAAARATSADDFFLRLEDAGVMLRIDRSVTPTMAKVPTIAQWEIDRLRTIEHVVRLGHVRHVERGRLLLDDGEVAVADDAVVVHCAAAGLRYQPLVPIWRPDAITLQPVRAGFPCFGAALAGFVEATIADDDEKNRYCPPSPFADTPPGWARMQLLGARSARAFGSHPAIKAWADTVLLNPSRIPPDRAGDPALTAALDRFRGRLDDGLAGLEALAGTAVR
jgi:hypothetical protein